MTSFGSTDNNSRLIKIEVIVIHKTCFILFSRLYSFKY